MKYLQNVKPNWVTGTNGHSVRSLVPKERRWGQDHVFSKIKIIQRIRAILNVPKDLKMDIMKNRIVIHNLAVCAFSYSSWLNVCLSLLEYGSKKHMWLYKFKFTSTRRLCELASSMQRLSKILNSIHHLWFLESKKKELFNRFAIQLGH